MLQVQTYTLFLIKKLKTDISLNQVILILRKVGITALYASGSHEGFDHSIEEIKRYKDNYLINKYNQPSNEYNPETTDLSGVQLDLQLFFNVGVNYPMKHISRNGTMEANLKRPENKNYFTYYE